ncbi:MAG: hypothetical protein N4A74_04130 [Carboxylicivirga sp.]|jgi:hypothetical protein|nr:hypothetical protein [Carboxylicivirga sp.]
MQTNSLDKYFKEQLKGQEQIPDGIRFNKDQLKTSIRKEVAKSYSGNMLKYAVILLILLLSGVWHWRQNVQIDHQRMQLAQQQGRLDSVSQTLLIVQQAKPDTIRLNVPVNETPLLTALPSLPAMVEKQRITVANTTIILMKQPVQLIENTITTNSESKVPELDLPIYYESERLAADKGSNEYRRPLHKKLSEIINN